jgi:hypothetical protein
MHPARSEDVQVVHDKPVTFGRWDSAEFERKIAPSLLDRPHGVDDPPFPGSSRNAPGIRKFVRLIRKLDERSPVLRYGTPEAIRADASGSAIGVEGCLILADEGVDDRRDGRTEGRGHRRHSRRNVSRPSDMAVRWASVLRLRSTVPRPGRTRVAPICKTWRSAATDETRQPARLRANRHGSALSSRSW